MINYSFSPHFLPKVIYEGDWGFSCTRLLWILYSPTHSRYFSRIYSMISNSIMNAYWMFKILVIDSVNIICGAQRVTSFISSISTYFNDAKIFPSTFWRSSSLIFSFHELLWKKHIQLPFFPDLNNQPWMHLKIFV